MKIRLAGAELFHAERRTDRQAYMTKLCAMLRKRLKIVSEECNLSVCPHLPNTINLLKPTGHVMHQQFNIQQLYALPTLYLCVLYLSENKQRLVTLTA